MNRLNLKRLLRLLHKSKCKDEFLSTMDLRILQALRGSDLIRMSMPAGKYPPQDFAPPIPAFVAPVNIGVANAPGVAATIVRSDHVHAHPAGLGTDLHHPQIHAPTHLALAADDLETSLRLAQLFERNHASLAAVGVNDHHAQLHQADHLLGGGDTFTHGIAEHTDVSRTYFWDAASEYSAQAPYAGYRLENNLVMASHRTARLPQDFVSVTSLYPVIMGSNNAGNVYRRVRVDFAASGELFNNTSNTSAYAAIALTNNRILAEAADFSAYLAGADVNDFIGLEYERDATHVDDTFDGNIWFLGWLLTITAAQ